MNALLCIRNLQAISCCLTPFVHIISRSYLFIFSSYFLFFSYPLGAAPHPPPASFPFHYRHRPSHPSLCRLLTGANICSPDSWHSSDEPAWTDAGAIGTGAHPRGEEFSGATPLTVEDSGGRRRSIALLRGSSPRRRRSRQCLLDGDDYWSSDLTPLARRGLQWGLARRWPWS
jgi:hypothetical protein